MTNQAERRSGRRRDGQPLQKACGVVASRRHAPAALHTFAGPAENQARRPRSSLAAASVTPEISCGKPWHLAAAWDAVWTCPRAAAPCKRSPGPATSKPAALPAATEPEDRGKARGGLAGRGGRSRLRKNPQSAVQRAPEPAPR